MDPVRHLLWSPEPILKFSNPIISCYDPLDERKLILDNYPVCYINQQVKSRKFRVLSCLKMWETSKQSAHIAQIHIWEPESDFEFCDPYEGKTSLQ